MNEFSMDFFNDISPYDEEYPINFLSSELSDKIESAKNFIFDSFEKISAVSPTFSGLFNANSPEVRWYADIPPEIAEAIANGLCRLDTDKNGNVFAQLRMKNGQLADKINLKQELLDNNNVDFGKLTNAVQMIALQEQMQALSDQLNVIDNHIFNVLQGLQNDRIGLYYSGVSLFLESRNILDKGLRDSLISQALSILTEAYFKLSLNLQSDIQYLVNKEYKKAKGDSVKLIDERMHEIDKEFGIIHQSAILRAAIYCSKNEIAAMTSVLSDYSRLINKVIAPNSERLIELDTRDNGMDNGIWNTRSKFNLDVSQIQRSLSSSEKTIYIGIPKEA